MGLFNFKQQLLIVVIIVLIIFASVAGGDFWMPWTIFAIIAGILLAVGNHILVSHID